MSPLCQNRIGIRNCCVASLFPGSLNPRGATWLQHGRYKSRQHNRRCSSHRSGECGNPGGACRQYPQRGCLFPAASAPRFHGSIGSTGLPGRSCDTLTLHYDTSAISDLGIGFFKAARAGCRLIKTFTIKHKSRNLLRLRFFHNYGDEGDHINIINNL